MRKKKGMQLSLNMIIYVILALVFLGIAISLIWSWMPDDITPPDMCEIYPPTAENKICAPGEIDLKRNKETSLRVAFYNDEDNDIPASVLPTINCNPDIDGNVLSLSLTSTGVSLPVGESSDYQLIMKVPKDATRSTYPCTIRLSATQESMAITIT